MAKGTASTHDQWVADMGLKDAPPSVFLADKMQIGGAKFLPYANAMRRVWDDFRLSGILCANNVPLVYFKEVSRVDPEEVRYLQRQLWNQGLAPLLVLITPSEVRAYSGLALPAKPDADPDAENRLVTTLNRVADALELRNFVRSVELGEVYRKYPASFRPEHRVDRHLLGNLKAARNLLQAKPNPPPISVIHALLGRSIFTCYLMDRGLLPQSYFLPIAVQPGVKLRDVLNSLDVPKGKTFLYDLFKKLKEDFNGDLFDVDLDAERDQLSVEHFDTIRRFLNGDHLEGSQLSLGFWAYDFRVIPIETISCIYEDFLEAESSKTRREIGAFYTPRHVVELVVNIGTEGWQSLLDKRCLDPACGSGIFLVALFNRMAEEWRSQHTGDLGTTHADALISILKGNLVGIDFEHIACRVACFSLYLALLDQLDSTELEQLRKRRKFLPNLLAPPRCPAAKVSQYTIICSNFFAADLPSLPLFDLITGNPPWGQERGPDKREMELWCEQQDPPRILANREKAQGYIWKTARHLNNNGRACLLLPASLLLAHDATYADFQKAWFTTHQIEKVINLSDMVSYLFDDSGARAMVVRYRANRPQVGEAFVDYIVPKSDLNSLRAELILIAPTDRVELRLRDILVSVAQKDAPSIWARHFWATPRDRKLLDRLLAMPKLSELAGAPDEDKRWTCGQGFQKLGKNDPPSVVKIPWWSENQLFLEGRAEHLDLFLTKADCEPIGDQFPELRRLPSKKIFTPPLVIANHGFTRIGIADFAVVFRSTYQSIHGPPEDRDLLMFLTAVWTSRLAHYFMFHTSSVWATYRGNLLEAEMMRMPFALPEATDDPKGARTIIKEITGILADAKGRAEDSPTTRERIVAEAKQQIQPLVFKYYDVDSQEQVLVNDTVELLYPSRIAQMAARGS